ncbi:hypothetical protein [Aquimarina macrocephali]|uniref:hypothetical protein n=1 Tax=Aquimarina macrocephali TaxID=666563 RepID=UPI0004643BED|nr:hypothetical protein [Aquimarina macrocephali]
MNLKKTISAISTLSFLFLTTLLFNACSPTEIEDEQGVLIEEKFSDKGDQGSIGNPGEDEDEDYN